MRANRVREPKPLVVIKCPACAAELRDVVPGQRGVRVYECGPCGLTVMRKGRGPWNIIAKGPDGRLGKYWTVAVLPNNDDRSL